MISAWWLVVAAAAGFLLGMLVMDRIVAQFIRALPVPETRPAACTCRENGEGAEYCRVDSHRPWAWQKKD